MSDIIDLLEKLGQDAGLRYAADAELENALIQAGVAGTVRAALVERNLPALESLLDARASVCCMIADPFREEDDDEELKESGDQSKEDKSKESSVLQPQHLPARRAA